ncbi:NAD(P)/FAD-dependent oxidoreductase [Actinomadura oligospora]|uniref:NAD(P)/FAD-dependent oxidoreductase n=1 Tax=Actinomadura oligospora TaxID=111804 RepID=UPI00047E8124|nr:FAD-dependent monooxygenase [Actinomadura oligospora]
MTTPQHAVVLGASWAGMLTAHVLARHARSVTVVERDVLPGRPAQRRGLPQARHVHVLWSGGARIVEDLLPGAIDRVLAAGARRVAFHEDVVTLMSHGWQHRFPARQYVIMGGRPLLDWAVREQVLADGRVRLRQRTEAVSLTGDARRVAGVEVRDVESGAREVLDADLVVDATGRGSGLRRWLSGLGLPPLDEDVVDAGIAYSTREFVAPPGATSGFPAVNVAADHRVRVPGRFGVVFPQEGGRWMVTLSCTRGGGLPTREEDFLPYARSLRDPLVADLIGPAEPITPVFVSHIGANRRLYPERLDRWPDGLLVLGDSLAAFNPIHGHGMSAAARAAAVLAGRLAGDGLGPGAAHETQREISAAVDDPWIMAASKDLEYVNCRNRSTDPRLNDTSGVTRQFMDLIAAKSMCSRAVSDVVTDVISMSSPQAELGSSDFLALMQRDGAVAELTGPPLSREELAIVNLQPRSAALR